MSSARTYHADWIDGTVLREERRGLSRLLRLCHGREEAERILAVLDAACREGRSLSAMLLHGERIVGCVLAIRHAGRPSSAEDPAPLQEHVDIEAFAVQPGHRSRAALLYLRLAAVYREQDDLKALPLYLRCTPRESASLLARRIWRRLGFIAMASDDPLHRTTHPVVLRPTVPTLPARRTQLRTYLQNCRDHTSRSGMVTVGLIATRRGWDLLEPHWNRLVEATPDATVFQTFEFLRSWWNHAGWGNELMLLVALREERPAAILPLQMDPRHWLGAEFRTVSFLGDPPDSDRPRLLCEPGDTELAGIMARDLLARAPIWDELVLAEQSVTDPFVRALEAQGTAAGLHVRFGALAQAPRVCIEGPWDDYLRGRSRALRKSLKRRHQKLEAQGHVDYCCIRADQGDSAPFEQYLAVERASWKHGTGIGALRDIQATALYREAITRLARACTVEFRFLRVNSRPVAATFGITWHGVWYSLHIAHDRNFDDCSPGVLLTARELEGSFESPRYRVFDFLSGTLTNKTSCATDRVVTRDLHVMRTGPVCSTFYLVYFLFKPAMKRLASHIGNWRSGGVERVHGEGHDRNAARDG